MGNDAISEEAVQCSSVRILLLPSKDDLAKCYLSHPSVFSLERTAMISISWRVNREGEMK
jgi:hypothetical protein